MANIDPVTGKNKGGRPEGSMSRLAKDARERAMATGMLPHEILLSMARGEIQKAQYFDATSGEIMTRLEAVDMEARRDAAKAAAPYYAPKLSTVELVKTSSDDELDAIIAELAAEAGFATGAAREGTPDGSEESADSGDTVASERNSRRRSRTFD